MDQQLKSDFPIDWVADNYVSRREFFKFLTLASGGLAVGSAGMALLAQRRAEGISFEPALVCQVGDVPVGGSFAFSYPRPEDICILVQPKSGQYVAFSRRCTHLSCPIDYQPDQNRIYCPCHNGAFSLVDGAVLQGPPPRPLPQIQLEVRGSQIHAVGVVRGEAKEA